MTTAALIFSEREGQKNMSESDGWVMQDALPDNTYLVALQQQCIATVTHLQFGNFHNCKADHAMFKPQF